MFLAVGLAVRHGGGGLEESSETKAAWHDVKRYFLRPDGATSIQSTLSVVGRGYLDTLPQMGRDRDELADADKKRVQALLRAPKLHSTSGGRYLFLLIAVIPVWFCLWSFIEADRSHLMELPFARPFKLSLGDPVDWARLFTRVGVILCVIFVFRGMFTEEGSSVLAGYSTWPRKVLHAVNGILAILAGQYTLNRFRATLRERSEHAAAEVDLGKHVARIGVASLTIVHCVSCFVYVPGSLPFCTSCAILKIALFVLLVKAGSECRSAGLSLHSNREFNFRICAFGMAWFATLTALAVGELFRHNGWYAWSDSRGEWSQIGDWVATVFGFAGVITLFVGLIYCYLWCIDLWRTQLRDSDSESRFETIAAFTGVFGAVSPILFALVLLAVTAYHPFVSPTTIPMSLLLICSCAGILFFLVVLTLRRNLRMDRQKTLAELAAGLRIARRNGLKAERERVLTQKERIEAVSEGIFQPWSQSPLGWIFGGTTIAALIDVWVRWYAKAL